MKPDLCTAPICENQTHCPDCLHAFYKGEGTDKDGNLWRWEYRPQFGAVFVIKAGKHSKFQPPEGDPAWELFEKWKKKNKL